jgi:hypothetical protein
MTNELSLQELQTVSGGNYLDNMGSLNIFVAAKVLPKINIAHTFRPPPQPWKKLHTLSR